MAAVAVRKVDAKGRVTLGQEYANQQLIVVKRAEGGLELIPATTVPAPEAWLYENPDAIRAVIEGLKQAAAGELEAGPDLGKDAALAEQLED